ncbi:MAG: hypothetical protein RBT60_04850 [Candidatus Krumholzibacteria bacterium]|jgi:hypothetical protein|nr:hypothetical protein [Candidatus Krumholzibacteria bacterium]
MRHARLDPGSRSTGLLLIVIAAGLCLGGCEFAEPALPTFTTRLTVPLGEEHLAIADLVDGEDYLVRLDDGALGFWVAGDPDTVGLGFDLTVDIPAETRHATLGSFPLELFEPTVFAFTLAELCAEAASLDGQIAPVPPFWFEDQSNAETIAGLTSATLDRGTLTVTLANGLPVAVSAPDGGEGLVIDLLAASSLQVLASVEFEPVPAGGAAERSADLTGVELPGAVAVRIRGGSPGSGEEPVTVDAGAALAIQIALSDLAASAAIAVVPAQTCSTSIETALPADYDVLQTVIDRGSLTVTMRNEMAIPCDVVVLWPDVVDLDQQPLRVSIAVPGGEEVARDVDFAGRLVQAPAGIGLRELAASVIVDSPGSSGHSVALQAAQGIQADFHGGRLEFASVTGTVPAQLCELVSVRAEIDLPAELEGLSLRRATLELTVTSDAGLPAAVSFELVGFDQHGASRSLPVQDVIAAADGDRAATTRIVLDETNSDIVAFLNHLPVEISLAGSVELGGDGTVGTIHRGDEAVVAWEITSPVEVVIESSQLYGDPKLWDLDDDVRDAIADHAGAAAVDLVVINHLPVGVEASLLIGPDPATLETEPLLVIGPVVIGAAAVDPDGYTVSAPLVCQPQVSLTEAQARLLATGGLHTQLAIALPATAGNPVRVMTTDYINVQGLCYLDVEVSADR